MIEDDIRAMPTDYMFRERDERCGALVARCESKNVTHHSVFRADTEGLINGYIVSPCIIYGIGSGPVRKNSMFFEMILDAYRDLGGRVAQIGPGTNIAPEVRCFCCLKRRLRRAYRIRCTSTTL